MGSFASHLLERVLTGEEVREGAKQGCVLIPRPVLRCTHREFWHREHCNAGPALKPRGQTFVSSQQSVIATSCLDKTAPVWIESIIKRRCHCEDLAANARRN